MKTFVKIVKTFFLIVFLLLLGILVGYGLTSLGYDKVLLGYINPAWGQTAQVDNTADVTNTATRDDRTISGNSVENQVVQNVANQTAVPTTADSTDKYVEYTTDKPLTCLFGTITHVSENAKRVITVTAKPIDYNDTWNQGTVTFQVYPQTPIRLGTTNMKEQVNNENAEIAAVASSLKLEIGMHVAVYHEGGRLETAPGQLYQVYWVDILNYPLQKEIPDYGKINQVTILNTKTGQMADLQNQDRTDFMNFINDQCAFLDNSYAIDSTVVSSDMNTRYEVHVVYDNGTVGTYNIVKYTDVFDPWYAVFKDVDGVTYATEFANVDQVEILTNILNRFGI